MVTPPELGWPHAANPVASIVETHGRPYVGAVRDEIGARKRSRILGIVLHGGDDFVRDPSPVEGVRAVARDGPHRLGIGAIDQYFARAFRAPVRVKEVGSGGREARKAGVLLNHMRKPRRNAEATLGDCRSGLEEPCPRHAAMGAVRTFKHRDDAWHSDRKAADSDRLPRARCAVRIPEKAVHRRRPVQSRARHRSLRPLAPHRSRAESRRRRRRRIAVRRGPAPFAPRSPHRWRRRLLRGCGRPASAAAG